MVDFSCFQEQVLILEEDLQVGEPLVSVRLGRLSRGVRLLRESSTGHK